MAWRKVAACLLGVSMALGSFAAPAAAQDDVQDQKSRTDQKVKSLMNRFEDLSKELATSYAKLQDAKKRLPDARSAVAVAQSKLEAAKEKDRKLASRLAEAKTAQQQATDDLKESQASIEKNRSGVAKMARRAYRNGGVSSNTAIWLQAAHGDDMVGAVTMVSSAVQAQSNVLRQLEEDRAVQRNARARLVAVRAKVAELKKESAAHVVVREAAQRKAEEVAADLTALVATTKKESATLAAAKSKTKNRLSAERKQQKALAAKILKQQRADRRAKHYADSGSSSGSSSSNSYLQNPAPGYPVTSNFGWRYHPIYHTRKLHAGTDFGVPCGTTVHAAAPGRVMSAGYRIGAGNEVVINHGSVHGGQLATAYKHNSRLLVHAGQRVSRGQAISVSGTTGWSTGCHLHFEVLRNGQYTNPLNWL
ncbi:peptidoglycan DD-metalloendopeptidase family protein [Spelaeicoccus albus]|uniref:Murein DD-endopeptidase MepM/ murein hydrolase activator NlpD n=1 Tax=Spelaeicoccus albus TaxID=1280376 RepID=A0A7Z0D5G3_9MICO|nr:peptidoglycan DD-metalloendopeptidase family protein [Spelaeicoccus albus]NYI69254.1 murein DD-endopeptidase MepM/ murein hydrolase activator NlpD [Spelaeicoccus albus]